MPRELSDGPVPPCRGIAFRRGGTAALECVHLVGTLSALLQHLSRKGR